MDDFLTPVSTTTVKRAKEPEPLIEVSTKSQSRIAEHIKLKSPEEIYKALKAQPDLESVSRILEHLTADPKEIDGFSLVTPGPVSAQIVDTLISTTIPDYWKAFKETGKHGRLLVKCLRNASGLGAIMSRLRLLIADCRQKNPVHNLRDPSEHIEDLIDILERIFQDDRTSNQIWNDIRIHAQNPIQKRLMWKEYVAQVSSGRILSLVAEAEDVLQTRGSSRKSSWLAHGNDYASWLGRNMAILSKENAVNDESIAAITEIYGKSLSLGYLGPSPENFRLAQS